jgi:hypothetical protein
MLLLVRRYQELDIDSLDMKDPYPNAEEILLAIERFTGRGFWQMGVARPPFTEQITQRKKWRGDSVDA